MDVIPAIDLLGGQCVRLFQGDYDQAEVYGKDPVGMALRWAEAGAQRLHLVDLDGAKEGSPVNAEAIATIAQRLSIPVQVGGGLRDRDTVARLLDSGVERAILGTVAVERPALVEALAGEFPGQIAVGIDARSGKVATGAAGRFWLTAVALHSRWQTWRLRTDLHRHWARWHASGPNLEELRAIAAAVSIPVIASGGVGSLTDLLSLLPLEAQGVSGVIVGKAFYTGAVDLQEALRAIGSGRWQDVAVDDSSRLA
nr:His4 [Synechococcus elongatus PCC 7942 = FACHB-805]